MIYDLCNYKKNIFINKNNSFNNLYNMYYRKKSLSKIYLILYIKQSL